MDDYCVARSGLIPPLPWTTFSLAFSLALVAEGYATAADTVALALEEQGRWTTSEPVTVAEASA